jgi:hypothetical protein
VETLDVGKLYAMGPHPVIINSHAGGWVTSGLTAVHCSRVGRKTREDKMAEIVMAYSAAHAPMQSADPGSAPPEQGERFFEAMKTVRELWQAANPQAAVMLSGEHLTNFFLDCLPQLAIGLPTST